MSKASERRALVATFEPRVTGDETARVIVPGSPLPDMSAEAAFAAAVGRDPIWVTHADDYVGGAEWRSRMPNAGLTWSVAPTLSTLWNGFRALTNVGGYLDLGVFAPAFKGRGGPWSVFWAVISTDLDATDGNETLLYLQDADAGTLALLQVDGLPALSVLQLESAAFGTGDAAVAVNKAALYCLSYDEPTLLLRRRTEADGNVTLLSVGHSSSHVKLEIARLFGGYIEQFSPGHVRMTAGVAKAVSVAECDAAFDVMESDYECKVEGVDTAAGPEVGFAALFSSVPNYAYHADSLAAGTADTLIDVYGARHAVSPAAHAISNTYGALQAVTLAAATDDYFEVTGMPDSNGNTARTIILAGVFLTSAALRYPWGANPGSDALALNIRTNDALWFRALGGDRVSGLTAIEDVPAILAISTNGTTASWLFRTSSGDLTASPGCVIGATSVGTARTLGAARLSGAITNRTPMHLRFAAEHTGDFKSVAQLQELADFLETSWSCPVS